MADAFKIFVIVFLVIIDFLVNCHQIARIAVECGFRRFKVVQKLGEGVFHHERRTAFIRKKGEEIKIVFEPVDVV